MFKRSVAIDRNRIPLIHGEMLAKGTDAWTSTSPLGLEDKMMEMLTKTSIPEQLNRADKSSMAFSTESRFPFLDYRLVAQSMHYYFKIHNGMTTPILRECPRERLPEAIYHRKDKVGFAVPVRHWINESLHRKMMEQMADARLPFVNTDAFLRTYAKRECIDWNFWKIGSISLWYQAFKAGHAYSE